MISREQAIQSVLDALDEDMDILTESTIEKDYGWLIFADSKEFIRTGDFSTSKVGSGGTLVERNSGNHISFGSVYSPEENLKIYEKGYLKYESWDIQITKVRDLRDTIDSLLKLRLSYVIPEEENGTIWRIPKEYRHKELKRKLAKLPATLSRKHNHSASVSNRVCCFSVSDACVFFH